MCDDYWRRWFIAVIGSLLFFKLSQPATVSRLSYGFRHNHKLPFRILYHNAKSEMDLPECPPMTICNRLDAYASPWIERQCRCPASGPPCSITFDHKDGHTIPDKYRQFKMCEPVSKLPTCKYFKDVTWTFETRPDNTTRQVMHCLCPKGSVAYIFKHQAYFTTEGPGYQYLFACSPQSRMRCQRKEPCRLFTVKKRPDVEEVNTNTLCQCPHGYRCPQHHNDHSVIAGTAYPIDHIRTYSGYCAP